MNSASGSESHIWWIIHVPGHTKRHA